MEKLKKKPIDDLFKPVHDELPKIQNVIREGNVFIEVSRYKSLLSGLNSIKKSLSESNKEVSSLIVDLKDEGELFNGLHENLLAIEEKLVDLENQLFQEKV